MEYGSAVSYAAGFSDAPPARIGPPATLELAREQAKRMGIPDAHVPSLYALARRMNDWNGAVKRHRELMRGINNSSERMANGEFGHDALLADFVAELWGVPRDEVDKIVSATCVNGRFDAAAFGRALTAIRAKAAGAAV